MKRRICAAFLFDGFADCELSGVMAALHRVDDYSLETFSSRGRPVEAASGLRVMPHASLSLMRPEDFDLLLLPGGHQWEKGDNLEVFPLIKAALEQRVVMAAGSAILALADMGILDTIPHTGPSAGYYKSYCPEYAGEAWFSRRPWVSAGNIITIDSSALNDITIGGSPLSDLATGVSGLFDTLQEIYHNDHELLDPAC